MCGIAGFTRVGARNDAETSAILAAMCDSIRYRGPDDVGYAVAADIALGMRRLSIIDLAGGHQPMSTADGRYTIVYNGEVYNFGELREELLAAGVTFRTASDTEVVLQLYARHGAAAFARLAGMFALAIHDRQVGRLVLCRDPIGIKPLYYYQKGATFVFGSEIKAVLRHPDVRASLNERAVWDYLTYEYVPGPDTMFRDMLKLRPGHYLELDLRSGQSAVTSYWDYPLVPEESWTDAEITQRFEALLREVVASQMVADVPVGVFLSGGLDSSAVTVLAREMVGSGLKTFCLGFAEGTLTDEAAQARVTAAYLGTDHHEYITNAAEYLGFLHEFVHYMDEPNADMAAIGKYFAARLAAQHVKVVLSGEGGDEMLCGYRLNEAMQRFDQLRLLQRLPRSLACDLPARALRAVGRGAWAERLEYAFLPLADRCAYTLPSMTRQYSEEEKARLFRAPPADVRPSLDVLRADFRRARTLGPLTQMQYAWSRQWLAEHLLMQADRMSMSCSLELRVPLLDVRLADFMFRVPDRFKVRRVGGHYQSKYLLRRFLAGRVPPEVLTRPKRGFQIPNIRFISQDLRKDIQAALCSPETRVAGFLDRREIEARLARAVPGADETTCQRVWILFILEMWCRRWLG